MALKRVRLAVPFLFLTLALVFAAGIGAASAASNDTIYVNASSGNDDYDGLSAVFNGTSGPKLTIKNATGTVNTNGTIYIADGQYIGESNTKIVLDRDVTIIGQSQAGTIINGTGTNWIFDIYPQVTVNLINMTLTNATRITGAAIFNYAGKLTVRGCSFTENVATALEEDYGLGGGAIYNCISGGVYPANLIVDGCTFLNNVARDGGAIYGYGLNYCTITNSIFNGNIATYVDGGAIENNGGILNLTNCNFTSNLANGKGGAIFTDVNFSAVNCAFTNNTADIGGAIYAEESLTIITGCNFTGNQATHFEYGGGAIYNDEGVMDINGCNFTQNNATASDGAALYNYAGAMNVTTSNFTTNHGGAIINEFGTLQVIGSTFQANHAYYHGAAIWNEGSCMVTGSSFLNNHADGDGGAIANYYWNLTVNFCRLAGNTADGDGDDIYMPNNTEENFEAPQFQISPNIENNWWGSNLPDFPTILYGIAKPINWLYMVLNVAPQVINGGHTSLITVSFNNLFNGTDLMALDPNIGHIPDGTPVLFTTSLGQVGSDSIIKYTFNGVAAAILRAWNENGDPVSGTATITATTDAQTISTSIKIIPTANAANAVGMQKTGLPLNYLLIAMLMVIGGFLVPRRK